MGFFLGIGDHGCEYMTGGRVIILGNTGRNFAAGKILKNYFHEKKNSQKMFILFYSQACLEVLLIF